MSSIRSSVSLHELVQAAVNGGDDEARVVLREILPALVGLVAAVLGGTELAFGPDATRHRDDVLEEVAYDLVSPAVLMEWQAEDPETAWRFAEERARDVARRQVDRVWVSLVVEGDERAKILLFRRLREVFKRAARKRGLSPPDLEDAFQVFSLWLIERDYAALQRWTPDGGRSFEGWFHARALNQIDTWRRRLPTLGEEDELGIQTSSHEARVIAARHVEHIRSWLQRRCSEQQQAVFTRWFEDGQGAAEIAAALRMTPAAVHMTVSRLRKAIIAAFPPVTYPSN